MDEPTQVGRVYKGRIEWRLVKDQHGCETLVPIPIDLDHVLLSPPSK